MIWDRFIMVDWSGGNDTGAKPRKDAIWAAVAQGGQVGDPIYLRNRDVAAHWLDEQISKALAQDLRLFVGFDFPFGYPAGFAAQVTGSDDPFALWAWLDGQVSDTPQANNRFDVAARLNRLFPGAGPFWGNGLKRDIADLPRKGTARTGHGQAERRQVETLAKGAFPVWQLSGAGAVGSQMLMGLPVLHKLRARWPGDVRIWPFEPLDARVAFVEVWPSLVASPAPEGWIKDAWQVAELARMLDALAPDDLAMLLDVDAPEEGWILGVGHADLLAGNPTPPPLRNDCFALPAGVDWTPVETALDHLKSRLHAVAPVETLPLGAASGRILARDVQARRAHPPLPNTAVDGYGFAGGRPEGAHVLPLVSWSASAGPRASQPVPVGQAVRILTGAALPDGVDTVVLQEDVALKSGKIAFHGPIKPGANTRAMGEDVQAGATVLQAGRRITPADLGLLAAVGCHDLQVYRPLRVGVLSTGDELVEPGASAGLGQIYDANRPMLLSLLARMGHAPQDLGRAVDDRTAIRAALNTAADRVDVILTSGGASAGDADHISALLTDSGAMSLWRIAVKPGRPLALGLWRGVPVFGLPGNPVAAMVCALVFACPALSVLAGAGWVEPQGFDLPAAFAKRKKPGRREYLRARIRNGRVEVFASEGSGRISGLSWAEGLVELPDGALDVTPGDPVRYIPWSGFGV